MSYSKTFNATAALVLLSVAAFPAEQRAVDEGYNAGKGVIDGHERQINASVKAVEAALAPLPPDTPVEVLLWSHASDDESGTFSYTVKVLSLPTPQRE